MKLKDVKAIVTGGASGMGEHFTRCLLEAGAQVAVGDVAEAQLRELPSSVHARRLDVRHEEECASFVAWAHEKMGGLNVLINNAGIIRDGLLVKRDRKTGEIKKLSTDDWKAVIDVNLHGATFMVREFVARLLTTDVRPGVIVNLSSLTRHGNRGQSNYVATKAAIAANTVTWALEFAPYGIRVGAVAPGMIETGMTKGMNQEALQKWIANIPAGRIGKPEDVWQAVRFVIECEYFTGRCVDVDGGLAMK